MKEEFLIGLDAGGGGCRCLTLNIVTGESTVVEQKWRPKTITESAAWGFDIDSDRIWQRLGEVTRTAMKRAGISKDAVIGISASSMRHGVVAIDRSGNVLLSTPNKDARAVTQAMKLASDFGESLYQRTGHWPIPIFMAPTLIWMADHLSSAFERVHAVLSISDWIGYKLCNQIFAEVSQAAESLVFDLRSRSWAGELIQEFGLRKDFFPQLVAAGTEIGTLTQEAGKQLGLKTGIPVSVGGGDTQSGLLGLGATSHGDLAVITGTTVPIMQVSDEAVIDTKRRLWTSTHLVPGKFVLESNAGGMGSSLEWTARTLYADRKNPIAALFAEANMAQPGAGGIFSTIGASIFNASEMSLPVDGLTFATATRDAGMGGRSDFARAVLEGMAYAVKTNIDQIMEVSNLDVARILVGGGMSRGRAWTQMISDIIGKPVEVGSIHQVTALGAAICAGVGTGVFKDLQKGADKIVRMSRRHTADRSSAKIYLSLFNDWNALREESKGRDDLAGSMLTEVSSSNDSNGERSVEHDFQPQIYVSADIDRIALDHLRKLGQVTYANYREGTMLVGDELVEKLSGHHVFVSEIDLLDAEDIQRLPDLRMVVVCRGNPVNVDIEACTAAGIPVVNTPGRNADAVADLTLGFLLMLARNLSEASEFLREPGGDAGDMGRMGVAHFKFQGRELWGKTVGLIGGGMIGSKVVERLLPFNTTVLVYDPFLTDDAVILMGAEKVDLDQLLKRSDFVSLHAPVNDATREMINTEAFSKLKEGASLVNTARAALVDNDALIEALHSGKLRGAALDVFPVEPPGSKDPILAFSNVIATPHMGGNTDEVAAHQGALVVSELKLLLQGETPRHILNPIVMEGFSWEGERKIMEKELQRLAEGPGPGVSDLHVEDLKDSDSPRSMDSMETPQLTGKKGGLFKRIFARKDIKQEQEQSRGDAAGQANQGVFLEIIERFTEKLVADEKLAESTRGKDVTLRYTIKDRDIVFFMSFIDGKVTAGLGDPSGEPQVNLKMNAEILDGMFSEKISGNKAAMTGKLSFSGDTRKAMSIQRFNKDMNRLYQAARAEIGDPGDLSIVKPIQPAHKPPPGVQAKQPASVSQQFLVGDVRDEIISITTELFNKSLITATGGNVSARTNDNSDEIWITPSAIFKGDLRPEMMVRIDLDGNLLDDNDYAASSERRVHCAIYKSRPDVHAIVHSHAPQTTLMAIAGIPFLPISTEAAFIGDVPVVPFIMPGTRQLGEDVANAMGEGIAVIMQSHGLVVCGSSLRRAADLTDIVEATAEKIISCKKMGIEPLVLPSDIVEELKEIGKMMV